jgi:hypothetical protein
MSHTAQRRDLTTLHTYFLLRIFAWIFHNNVKSTMNVLANAENKLSEYALRIITNPRNSRTENYAILRDGSCSIWHETCK